MSTLLSAAVERLRARGVKHALIGAGAMAVHGVARATLDLDLLVLSRDVLHASFWEGLERTAAAVRPGNADDPLAGVVELARDQEIVDVMVGKLAWQQDLLLRARPREIEGTEIPVVSVVDLILLKLYAGGPQDAWDVSRLLAITDRESITEQVDARLNQLPPECARTWRKVLAESPK